jgi:hypothetical protein
MKNTLKLVFGVLGISIIAFTSCKKKKDESAKAKLEGKWKIVQSGIDANNNNVMEATEVSAVPDSLSSNVTFNGDGNGTISAEFMGTTISFGFTWSLLNSDADIKIKPAAGSGLGTDETILHISSLSFSDLVTSDTTTTSGVLTRNWSVYKKQ